MKFPPFAAAGVFLISIVCPVSGAITFGPVRGQAGESVKLVTHSDTTGGTIERTVSGKTSKGTISITRDRELVWTFRAPTADGTRRGMVRVPRITTTSKIKIDGKEENTTDDSPLTGKMFAMTKSPTGDWTFELDGSLPLNRIQTEIDSLKVYLKRDWYPAHEVNLGDSWEFDPAWIKSIIEKDLSKAQTIGTMSLRQIRHTQKGQIAVIDVTVRSSGGDFKADGSESSASVELKGEVIVNLNTMLDEFLELKGTLTTSASPSAGVSTTVKLPIHLTATKSFVRE